MTENAQLQKQLHVSESEKQMLRQQLTRKEAELTRAEETIRREQQLMRQLVLVPMYTYGCDVVCVCVCVCVCV